jgi:hypothetical protein
MQSVFPGKGYNGVVDSMTQCNMLKVFKMFIFIVWVYCGGEIE